MADIPLKSEEETTTDLVGAIEDIAQSVKAGSRDFSKTFGGLTTAIKKLQTTLVNAIKSIKVQVVTKPEKPVKQPAKVKETSTKEVVKEKETKTEVKPEPKAKVPKIEKVINPAEAAKKEKKNKIADESAEALLQTRKNNAQLSALRLQNALNPTPKAPPKEKTKPVDPQEKERLAKEKAREKEIEKRQEKVKPVRISSLIEGINQTGDAWSKMISGVRNTVADIDNARKEEEKQVAKTGKEGTKEFVGPPQKLFINQQNKEKQEKDKYEKEVQERQRKLKPVNVSSLITGINQVGDAWSKVISNVKNSVEQQAKIKEQEEKNVIESGNEKSKKFVGPPKKLFDKNERKISDAAEKEKVDEAKRRDDADREAANAEKTLRTYFRKQEERQASQEEKAANDLIKQQEQAARELAQANQKTKRELDSLVAGFQGLSSLFKGPLVRFGLNMVAKGVGYKQPKTMSKGGDVSYLADGGTAMKPKGTDTQPAMLTPGEFVVNKSAAQDPENRKQLESINSGKNKKKVEYHSSGGSVGGVGYYAAGGPVMAAAGVAIAAVGTVINSVTKSFAIASEAVSSFASAVQKANPALMEQVGLAMDDLQAVIGRALTPVITMIIPLIRDFADYVDYAAKKFAPAVESIVKISKDLMKPMLELGVTIINSLMPFVKLLVLQFGGVVKILIPVIDLLSSLFETLTLLIEPLGDSEFLFGVFNNSIEILSRAVSIVAGTIQLVIGAFVVGVSKMIEVLGAMVDYIPFSGDAGKSIEGFGEKVGKVGEKLYNKSLENFRAVGEGKPRRFKAGEMSGDKGLQKDSSYGAAVRQVQSFSIAGIGDEMRKNALMAGVGQKTQEESLNQIEKNTGEMVELFKNMKVPQGTGAGAIVGPKPQIQADKWKDGSWW